MPILIDGDNLLGSWPGRSRSDDERTALSREVGSFAAREGKAFVLCFDGTASLGQHPGPSVLFSGPGRTADELILGHLKRQQDPRGFLVVTNDRSLADRCRWLGAKIERCDVFRKRLEERGTRDAKEKSDPADVDYWLEVFGKEDDDT